jgi:hypothetical protein
MANLPLVHRLFLGTQLTETQSSLYLKAKEKGVRGYSSKDPSEGMLDATISLAISLAKEDGEPKYHQVYLFTSAKCYQLVLDRIQAIARTMKGRVKEKCAPEAQKDLLKTAQTWLSHLAIGTPKLLDLQTKPDFWVSIGYSKDDEVLPDWFRTRLLG